MYDSCAAVPARRTRGAPRKCSTCADKSCRVRGGAVDWVHCDKWTLEPVRKDPGPPEKPQNPYRSGTNFWRLYEGDWADKTTVEIAQLLGTSVMSVRVMMKRIWKKTGYAVEFRRKTKE